MNGSMNTMPQNKQSSRRTSQMSQTAREYFNPKGEYTGYVSSNPIYEQGHMDGAVTKEHSSQPMGTVKPASTKTRKQIYDNPGGY